MWSCQYSPLCRTIAILQCVPRIAGTPPVASAEACALIIEHRFAKIYGLRHIISELRRQNIPDCKIPAQKQLENRLYYFRKRKFGYHNEIGPLEEKLRKFVFSGDEVDEQAFIYHYQTDRHDRLCVGDGSDK
jgi:hypothetical protein